MELNEANFLSITHTKKRQRYYPHLWHQYFGNSRTVISIFMDQVVVIGVYAITVTL